MLMGNVRDGAGMAEGSPFAGARAGLESLCPWRGPLARRAAAALGLQVFCFDDHDVCVLSAWITD